MNKKYFLAIILLVSACQKHVTITNMADSRLSFFNVSEYLQLQTLNTGGQYYLLIDSADTAHNSKGISAPSFSGGQYQYPNPFYNTRLPSPWISYMRVDPGQHTIILTDTGAHHFLDTTVVTTDPASPRSVYYADSLGRFGSWVLADSVVLSPNTVGLRVLDLSPDAGKVFFTIGGQPATGFPDSLRYGQTTGFTPWTNPVADTLQIRFFHVGDSVDVLTSASLSVLPAHAYNIVMTGYWKNHSYKDPYTGKFLSINADLKVVLTQNN